VVSGLVMSERSWFLLNVNIY